MFKFKQFSIRQSHSAMKVCTDSCLFGALVDAQSSKMALDIGTGTGLLSLMLAQRFPELQIDAVEIDENALIDAKVNVDESQFKNQIKLIGSSIQEFENLAKYDLIFSNPPFYQENLKSPDKSKNTAHHCTALSFSELAESVKNLLKPSGAFWVLLPPFEMTELEKQLAASHIFPEKSFFVKHNEKKPIYRVVAKFTFQKSENPISEEILIYENDKYSRIFTALLQQYYLIF